jgi:hypothetical protein
MIENWKQKKLSGLRIAFFLFPFRIPPSKGGDTSSSLFVNWYQAKTRFTSKGGEQKMNTKFNLRILALFLIMAGVAIFSLYKTRPPAVVPASASETKFSAERAMDHVVPISKEPHPTGSPEIYQVRDYILGQMEALGLEAEVQRILAQNPLREDEIAMAENILARIPGTNSSQAIVFISHYDSAPHSPGAGDDAAAVAVMIETARALTAGPPLKNDVILLFSDAEESIIGGANAAREHPWLSEAGLVINLEMRGASGPVYMFETGPENGWIIPEFAKAVPYPATSSLMRDVYTNMPNNTDFTAFREAGFRFWSHPPITMPQQTLRRDSTQGLCSIMVLTRWASPVILAIWNLIISKPLTRFISTY